MATQRHGFTSRTTCVVHLSRQCPYNDSVCPFLAPEHFEIRLPPNGTPRGERYMTIYASTRHDTTRHDTAGRSIVKVVAKDTNIGKITSRQILMREGLVAEPIAL